MLMGNFAVPRHHKMKTRQTTVIYVLLEVGVEVSQALRVETRFGGTNFVDQRAQRRRPSSHVRTCGPTLLRFSAASIDAVNMPIGVPVSWRVHEMSTPVTPPLRA